MVISGYMVSREESSVVRPSLMESERNKAWSDQVVWSQRGTKRGYSRSYGVREEGSVVRSGRMRREKAELWIYQVLLRQIWRRLAMIGITEAEMNEYWLFQVLWGQRGMNRG